MALLIFFLLYYCSTKVFHWPVVTVVVIPFAVYRILNLFKFPRRNDIEILLFILFGFIDIFLAPFFLVSQILFESLVKNKVVVIFFTFVSLFYLIINSWNKFTPFLLFDQLTVFGHFMGVIGFIAVEYLRSRPIKYAIHFVFLTMFFMLEARTGAVLYSYMLILNRLSNRTFWGILLVLPFLFVYVNLFISQAGSSDYYRFTTVRTTFQLVLDIFNYDSSNVFRLFGSYNINLESGKVLFDNTFLTLYFNGLIPFMALLSIVVLSTPKLVVLLMLDDYTNGLLITSLSIFLRFRMNCSH